MDQPLSAPAERPSTTKRRSSNTRITDGANATRQIAIIRLWKTKRSLTRLAITPGKVMNSARLLRIKGISRSFQATMKTIAPYDANAGVDSGNVTRRKAPKREQPSIRAASSSSRGTRSEIGRKDHHAVGQQETGQRDDDAPNRVEQ